MIPILSNPLRSDQRSRGRVVKATDLKSVGIFPRRFESCRLRQRDVLGKLKFLFSTHINLDLSFFHLEKENQLWKE